MTQAPSLRLVPALLLLVLVLVGLLLPARARAADPLARLRGDLLELSVAFEAFQADTDRRIPPAILQEARGLLILRERRAGLLVGGRHASGVVLLRQGRDWGTPVFVRGAEGNIGLQAGWQEATFFHVLMSEAAVEAVRARRFRLGVDLRVTSGPRTLGDALGGGRPMADVLVYADTAGVFGGVALGGGWLAPDEKANRRWYERESGELFGGQVADPGSESAALSRLVAVSAAAP